MRTIHDSTTEALAGLVERVTFHNEDNGFDVLRVKPRGNRDLITVAGHAAGISAGEFIQTSGEWANDRTHGVQFRARFLNTMPPATIEGIEKYLGSGMIRGIGSVYACGLAQAFGSRVFDVIEAEPHRLRDVRGSDQSAPMPLARVGPISGRSASHISFLVEALTQSAKQLPVSLLSHKIDIRSNIARKIGWASERAITRRNMSLDLWGRDAKFVIADVNVGKWRKAAGGPSLERIPRTDGPCKLPAYSHACVCKMRLTYHFGNLKQERHTAIMSDKTTDKRLKYGFGEFKMGDAWRYYNVPLERVRNAAQIFGQRHGMKFRVRQSAKAVLVERLA